MTARQDAAEDRREAVAEVARQADARATEAGHLADAARVALTAAQLAVARALLVVGQADEESR